jgi:hypothetical protein
VPKAGQILFHKNFTFSSGEKGKKLVVVLNTCKNDETCLVLKTTSQSKWYSYATPGCNSCKEVFFILEECDQGFPEDTYVQLDSIYPVNIEQLLSSRQLSFVDNLSEICLKNLKKCLRNFKDDIPQQYWAVIYSSK